jgi:hypothetical protein
MNRREFLTGAAAIALAGPVAKLVPLIGPPYEPQLTEVMFDYSSLWTEIDFAQIERRIVAWLSDQMYIPAEHLRAGPYTSITQLRCEIDAQLARELAG